MLINFSNPPSTPSIARQTIQTLKFLRNSISPQCLRRMDVTTNQSAVTRCSLFPPPALASTHTCTLSIRLITKNTTHFSYTLAADWPRCRSYTNTQAPTRTHAVSETDRHMPDAISLNKWPKEKFIMCVRVLRKKTTVELYEEAYRSDGDGDK